MNAPPTKGTQPSNSPIQAAASRQFVSPAAPTATYSALGQAPLTWPDDSPALTAQRELQESVHASPRQTTQAAQLARLYGQPMPRAQEEEEPIQGEFEATGPIERAEGVAKPNNTGLPDNLKSGIESLSGMSMDNVKVHYNSPQPAQLNAHAYAQGTDIHVAPEQEQHLPHEAWHVVQQAHGRVRPTLQMKGGVPVNDDQSLEHEADVMGGKAASIDVAHGKSNKSDPIDTSTPTSISQLVSQCAEVVQREQKKSGISGLTHLVRMSVDGSIYEGEELDGDVTDRDVLMIETSDKVRSRRGPNQELYSEQDAKGGHEYRWFRVLWVNGDDYREDIIYVRDDALTLDAGEKSPNPADHPRDRVDTMEEALKYLPGERGVGLAEPSDLWNRARDSKLPSMTRKMAFGQLWSVCGSSSENMIARLNEIGSKPKQIAKITFTGRAKADAFEALLSLPVTTTTLVQVSNPLVHEFTLEKRKTGHTFMHQGYLSKFDALWWADLADSNPPHFVMDGRAGEKMKAMRKEFGSGRPINLPQLVQGLGEVLRADKFGAEATKAWSRLPFPQEDMTRFTGSLSWIVTVFQFDNENAVYEEFNEEGPLVSLVMRESAKILAEIEAAKNQSSAKSGGGLAAMLAARQNKK